MPQITIPGLVCIANIAAISRMFLLLCVAMLALNLSYASIATHKSKNMREIAAIFAIHTRPGIVICGIQT